MVSIRSAVTLLFALTLGLAPPVAAQQPDLVTGLFGGPFVEQLCESPFRRLLPGVCFTDEEKPPLGADLTNTALGFQALTANTTGSGNTALGFNALANNTTGSGNTATGAAALTSNSTGGQNTAVGQNALGLSATGSSNTAVGSAALETITTGSGNTAIGANAGVNVTTGNDNIHINNSGTAGDNLVIRIGIQGLQTSTSISGIFGATVFAGAMAVEVDSTGQLGTANSSRRVKDDIRDMDDASGGLAKLRPVTFHYKAEQASGPRPIEYGLIAEEVAEIYPELVVRDTDGQPTGVRYHVLPAMLLNELQRQRRERQAEKVQTEARLATQQQEIDELRAQVRALVGAKAAARE
jgi:Chaperone of endosialidase